MSKVLDPHRKVSIDYSVLKELLEYIAYNDGTFKTYYDVIGDCGGDGIDKSWFPDKIKTKARNIIENS